MIPESLNVFFTTSAAAAATLIGFLSVANSVIGQKDNQLGVSLHRGILAESAYGALANIFFVALAALVPFVNIGYIAVIMALVGFATTRRFAGQGLRKLAALSKTRARVSTGLLLTSITVYEAELIIGLIIIFDSDTTITIPALVCIIVVLYGIGLARAWELLGVREALKQP